MSATHTSFGAGALKLRSTRSGAGRLARSRVVVVIHLRRLTPQMPVTSISRATRLRPTRTPCAASSA
jgi:hypothetical protein